MTLYSKSGPSLCQVPSCRWTKVLLTGHRRRKSKMSHAVSDLYDSVKNRQGTTVKTFEKDSYHILDIEIDDHGINACSSGICDIQDNSIVLLKYNEIPDFLKGNPYVVKGYRSMLPFSSCLKSLLLWSNETINIWSHLVGFFIFLLLILWDNLIELPRMNGAFADHIIITLALGCFMICMGCSAGFHIFCCHSERASRRWLAVDMTGVSLGIIGCYLPAVHYAFYCLSIWRDIYLLSVAVLTACTLVFQLHPHFFTHRWFYLRMALYIGLSGYGVIPAIHWIFLNGGIHAPIVQLFVPKVIMIYMIGALAFAFYISKVPERILPGKCDYLGSSHQIWHILIVIAFLYWHKAGEEFLRFRLNQTCPT